MKASVVSLQPRSIALGSLVGAAVALILGWAIQHQSYNVWGAIVVVPILIAINAVLIVMVGQREGDAWLTKLLAVAFAAKMIGTLGRYYVAYVAYNGVADADHYNTYAAAAYSQWRQGNITWAWGGKQGTQFMELITTAIYTVIGPSPMAGFVVFSSFAFWGAYLMYRAFRLALPAGNHKRFALLLFLLPSMLYWPSSIGKEAWLFLFVGVTALGVARRFAGRVGALPLLLLGAAGTALIRPHLAVLMFAALLVAQLFQPTSGLLGRVVGKFVGLILVGVAVWILTTRSAEFLGIDDFSWQSVTESVDAAGEQVSEGGSAFTPASLGSPTGVLQAIITVLFRPFPWEAHNLQMLLQAVEGLLLLFLTVRSWPQLRGLPGLLRRNPFVLFCLAYVAAFIVAFAGFGNFGILARQRVLMLPFFLVLLALPARGYRPEGLRRRRRLR